MYIARYLATAERAARFVRLLDRWGFRVDDVESTPRIEKPNGVTQLAGYIVRASK